MDWNQFWSNVGKNMAGGYEDSVDMFKLAGESFSGGNVLGGVYQGAMGALNGLGNTISLGGAHAYGEKVWDSASSKIEITPTYYTYDDGTPMHGYFGEDGKIVVCEDKFDDGSYMYCEIPTGYTEMKKKDGAPARTLFEMYALSEASGQNYQRELVDDGKVGLANALGGVDTAGLVFDVVGGAALANSVKTSVKAAVKPAVSAIFKKAGQEAVEETAEAGATIAGKEAAETAVKAAVKDSVKKAAKETSEEAVEIAAKNAGKEVAKNGTKSAFSALTKPIIGEGSAKAVKPLAVALGVSSQINSDRVGRIEKDGIVTFAKASVSELAEGVEGSAEKISENVFDKFFSEHKGITKIVNSCRAATTATVETAKKVTPCAYAVASCSMAKAKFDAWATGNSYKYVDNVTKEKLSIGEVADQIEKEADSDTRSWSKIYSDRVSELDKKYNIYRSDDAKSDVQKAEAESVFGEGSYASGDDTPSLA